MPAPSRSRPPRGHAALRALLALALASAAPVAGAAVYTLDFGPAACAGACAPGSFVDQAYGDVAGVLDISSGLEIAGTPAGLSGALRWAASFGAAVGAAAPEAGGFARIVLVPAAGATVRLVDFTLAVSSRDAVSYQVRDIGAPFATFVLGTWSPTTATDTRLFDPTSATSGSGLALTFGGASGSVALDRLTVSVTSPVPEPRAWAAMLVGLGLVGLATRRRGARGRAAGRA